MSNKKYKDIARAIYGFLKGKEGGDLSIAGKKIAHFLYKKRLLSKYPEILKKIEEIGYRDEEAIQVKVLSAKKLEEGAKIKVASLLKEKYKVRNVFLKEKIDASLLGGIRVETEEEIIDVTVKNKMRKLKESLTS